MQTTDPRTVVKGAAADSANEAVTNAVSGAGHEERENPLRAEKRRKLGELRAAGIDPIIRTRVPRVLRPDLRPCSAVRGCSRRLPRLCQ